KIHYVISPMLIGYHKVKRDLRNPKIFFDAMRNPYSSSIRLLNQHHFDRVHVEDSRNPLPCQRLLKIEIDCHGRIGTSPFPAFDREQTAKVTPRTPLGTTLRRL